MQQIIVIIILVVTIGIIGWRVYKLLIRKQPGTNRCAGCDIDCALRNLNSKDCDKDETETEKDA